VRNPTRSLVGKSAQAKGRTHLGKLNLKLAVVGAIKIDSATTILVLANLGENHSGRIELSRLLN
jgi:hypothetical protein